MTLKQLAYRAVGVGINLQSYLDVGAAGRRAFYLFATPPPPRIRPKEADFLATATRTTTRFTGLEGTTFELPVYSWGPAEGPVVFCAYGFGYNAGRWRHFVPGLVEAGYRVVAFDPPGHGYAPKGHLIYPDYVALERQLIEELGGIDLVLVHSFGGGCLVEALAQLPAHLRPRRACFMAIFSEVRWLFEGFRDVLRLRPAVFAALCDHIHRLSGRELDEFEVTKSAGEIDWLETLLVHDPRDEVTSYRSALRNHSHWPNSWLYGPVGAGHHLGTAEVTRNILAWLLEGEVPEGSEFNDGSLEPITVPSWQLNEGVAGVSTFYT